MLNYKEIKENPRYLINKDGKIFDTLKNRFVTSSSNPDGYLMVTLYSIEEKCIWRSIHRLLAKTFIENDNVDKIIVNHKNGIKTDNSLENLEWCTYQENTEHAGRLGLTSKCLPILVRDTKTLDVKEYPSATAAGLVLNLTKDAVLWRLASDGQKTWPEYKQYKIMVSESDWGEIEDPKIGRNTRVTVRSLLTGTERVFDNQNTAAEFLGISIASISILLSKGQPVFTNHWQAKYDDVKEWIDVDDYYLALEIATNTRCCVVWNDKIITIYENCVKCANALRIKPTALNYRLTTKGKSVFRDGMRYAYYSDYKQGCL